MVIYLSLLVAIIGLLVYVLSANPKVSELGRVSFFAGLLAFLICVCHNGTALGIVPR